MALRKKTKKRIRNMIIAMLLGLVLAAIIVTLPTYLHIRRLYNEAQALVAGCTADTFRSTQTTVAYDADGEHLLSMRASKDMYYVEYEQIPQAVLDAFIVSEDRKFYEHKGIDYKSIVRAFIANRESNEIQQGASTITQQLARNVFLSTEVTWERKITEMFIALELEKRFTKEQILEFYCNNIYFANGNYGIEAAARGYFDKDITQLTLPEQIFIVAIPNNPTKYNPVEHYDAVIERRNLVLKQMYEADKINTANYYDSIETQVELNTQSIQYNNYVDTYVRRCATESLMQEEGFRFINYFETQDEYNEYCELYDRYYGDCQQKLFGGGYSIYTSIDKELQTTLQAAIDDNLAEYTEVSEDGVYTLQAAATCIDNATGNVVAIVGGRTQDFDGYTLNRAYQSYRQPGSSIKPLNVYTPYLQLGATPSSVVTDEAIEDGPDNADRSFLGDIKLRDAVKLSKNTVAWKIYEKITPRAGTAFLLRMGFKKIFPDRDNLSGCLGGFTYGVTTEEMAAGFATIENDGIYRNPTCIVKITTLDGKVLVDNSRSGERVYEENASRMMTDMMMTVMEEGTGTMAAPDNAITAGKTGTTNDNKDAWFVGYSRYYTTSVWTGYDMPRELGGAVNCSKAVFHDYMTQIHTGLPQLPFAQYTLDGGRTRHVHGEEDETIPEPFPAETVPPTTDGQEHTLFKGGDADATIGTSPGYGDSDADIHNLGDQDASSGVYGDVDVKRN